jgi:hypothetical protein
MAEQQSLSLMHMDKLQTSRCLQFGLKSPPLQRFLQRITHLEVEPGPIELQVLPEPLQPGA